MPIKYNLSGHGAASGHKHNRWENPRRSPSVTKRRILYINAGILLCTLALAFYTLRGAKPENRWLPARLGEGRIIAVIDDGDPAASRIRVEIEVDVPVAEPGEAQLLPADVLDPAERLGPLKLRHLAEVDARMREVLAAGQVVEVMYQIDVARERVFVREVRPAG